MAFPLLNIQGQLKTGKLFSVLVNLPLLSVQGQLKTGKLFSGIINLPLLNMGGTVLPMLVLPQLSLKGNLTTGKVINAMLTLPQLSIEGQLASSPALSEAPYIYFPPLTVYGEGIATNQGIANIVLKAFVLSSSGILSIVGSNSSLSFPSLRLVAVGEISNKGIAEILFPKFTLTGLSAPDITGVVSILFPSFNVFAQGVSGCIGTFEVSFPCFTLSAFVSSNSLGTLEKSFPMFSIFGQGVLSDIEYLTMVLNLRNKALTLYEAYSFNSFCQINGLNFGADSVGIYNLDSGITDDGSVINWNFRIGYLDLEQKTKKKLTQAWMSYKSDGDIVLTVIQPDGQEFEYLLEGINETEEGVRVVFGRGLRSKYIALDIRNENGSMLDLDVIKLHLLQTGKQR